MAHQLRYSEFESRIDIDAFEAAIEFTPTANDRGNDIGFCPFTANHKNGDTTGKFAIHRDKRLFNCYVCGGGDLLSLAMLVTGLDTEQATEWIHQFAGEDARTDDDFADYLIALLADVEERVETTPYFNPRVLERFDGPTDYFHSRGISDESAKRLDLRYSDSVLKTSPIKTGKGGERIKEDEDYMGPASIWPHYWQGRLVGWQYRWHDWDHERTKVPRWLPKWTNTSDFPKSTTVYNYDRALATDEPVVVCESLGTVAFLDSYGVPAVAWFGSKPSEQQFRLLRRFQRGVILAPDNDSNAAGDKIYAAGRYLERYIPVWVADKVRPQDVGLEEGDGLDLNDYANLEDPMETLFDHLVNRTHEWNELSL